MRFFPYEDKGTKKKAKAIDAISILETMKELEEYNGTHEKAIVQNYYELKRQVRDVIIAVEEEKEKKEKKEGVKENGQ